MTTVISPRVIAIIEEALAVEVLPPDNSAKLRMINLVNQVKVPSPLSLLLSRRIFAGQCGRVRGLCDGAAEESNTGDPHQLAGIHLDTPRALSRNLKSDWIVWSRYVIGQCKSSDILLPYEYL